MQMLFELLVARIVIAAYSCLFDLPVHPLHLVIGPGLFYFCQSVLNSMLVAYPIGYDLNFFFSGRLFPWAAWKAHVAANSGAERSGSSVELFTAMNTGNHLAVTTYLP